MNPDPELNEWANEYEHLHKDDIEEEECTTSQTE